MNRRDFYRLGSLALGGAITALLAIPGVKFVLDPLNKNSKAGGMRPLTTLSQLKVGEPQAFPIVEERFDAWVKFPREPVGSVWLVRQKDDTVVAFTAECPHLGCAIGLAADKKGFFCPCHQGKFRFDGSAINEIPPRGMDTLEIALSTDDDPRVSVKFEHFRTQIKERKPLA